MTIAIHHSNTRAFPYWFSFIADSLLRFAAKIRFSGMTQASETLSITQRSAVVIHPAQTSAAVITTDRKKTLDNTSPLSSIHVISLRVVTYTQRLMNFAEQLKIQTHEHHETDEQSLLKIIETLTQFCEQISAELLTAAMTKTNKRAQVNGLSYAEIEKLVNQLLEGDKSIEEFMAAFVTASYQHPQGYQLCLSVVGSGGDWVGKVGISLLRGVGAAMKTVTNKKRIISVVVAVIRTCWILEQTKVEKRDLVK